MALYKCIVSNQTSGIFYKKGKIYDLGGTPSATFFSAIATAWGDEITTSNKGVPAYKDADGQWHIGEGVQFDSDVVQSGDITQSGTVTQSGAVIQTVAPTNTTNAGTAGTGVTATEYGNGIMHITKLTFSITDAFTIADNAALSDGYLLYTFPLGQVLVHGAAFTDVALTAASTEAQADTPDVGLGTTIGSGANALLSAVGAGAENIITGQTAVDVNGAATSIVSSTALAIADQGDHTVYLNIADTWADDTSADLTVDVAGDVYLIWSYLGNPSDDV